MTNRYKDALMISDGACNPSGIALAIVEACREMRAEPNHQGTDEIRNDPAIRLMVHQLTYLVHIDAVMDLGEWQRLRDACERGVE